MSASREANIKTLEEIELAQEKLGSIFSAGNTGYKLESSSTSKEDKITAAVHNDWLKNHAPK